MNPSSTIQMGPGASHWAAESALAATVTLRASCPGPCRSTYSESCRKKGNRRAAGGRGGTVPDQLPLLGTTEKVSTRRALARANSARVVRFRRDTRCRRRGGRRGSLLEKPPDVGVGWAPRRLSHRSPRRLHRRLQYPRRERLRQDTLDEVPPIRMEMCGSTRRGDRKR